MVIFFSKKFLISCVCVVVAIIISCSVFFLADTKFVDTTPNSAPTIIIDAGHGGRDGGSVGKTTGVLESDLTLIYAINLSNTLGKMNFNPVLTRKTNKGLYDEDAPNRKKSDMTHRQEIIQNSKPNLIISLHMNAYPLPSCKGAQVFFEKGSEMGKNFADAIQTQFCGNIENTNAYAKAGEFYITSCYPYVPAVIVECGFLTNPQEEKLLQTKEYQNKICYLIIRGIISYLNAK